MKNDNVNQVYETEKKFWKLIAQPEPSNSFTIYKASDKLKLHEANKIVVEQDEFSVKELNSLLFKIQPSRLNFAPTVQRATSDNLISIFDGITYRPDGNACLYLWANELMSVPTPDEKILSVRKADYRRQEDIEITMRLRSMKDHAIEDEDVRAALRTWTKRRIELITGFRTFILYEYSEPIGCVSCFRAQNITRIRDLFIQKDFRSRGYSKFLFSGIKKMPGPFAIVTDTDNSAIYPYRKLGFEPIFVAEAYLILNYDKNKQ